MGIVGPLGLPTVVRAVSRPGGPGWVNAWPFGPRRPNGQKSATHLNALPYVSGGACLVSQTAVVFRPKGHQFIQPVSKATRVPGGDESRTRNKMRINTKLLNCYLSHSPAWGWRYNYVNMKFRRELERIARPNSVLNGKLIPRHANQDCWQNSFNRIGSIPLAS